MPKKTPTTMTYAREPVPHDKTGQCPCCLKQHRASGSKNALQRHGWKESGRQVGEHGQGFQWGACHGSGMRPLEETDRSAVVVLGWLAAEIEKTTEAVALHAKGTDTYRAAVKVDTYDDERTRTKVKAVEDVLRTAGVVWSVFESRVKSSTRRCANTRLVVTLSVEVVRGASGINETWERVGVPSWETLRAEHEAQAAAMLKALRAQETAIKAAVAFHFANPSNGGVDQNNRGPACHFKRTWIRPAELCSPGLTDLQRTRTAIDCGAQEYRAFRNTAVEAEVTCARCLKSMVTRKKDAEKRAAQKEREVAREAKHEAKLAAQAAREAKLAGRA